MNAPLGQTRTGTPLTVAIARPFPTEPRMNVESREAIIWLAWGYTTRGARRPSTRGIAGSTGLTVRAASAGVGAVAGEGPRPGPHAASAAPRSTTRTPDRGPWTNGSEV